MTDRDDVEALRVARDGVLERIGAACALADRDPDSVALVAVGKGVDRGRLRDAVEIGLTTLGENRVQEAAGKIPDVPGATWHLVGPLQSNKARKAVELFDVIESVDSVGLARRLDRLVGELRPGGRYPILVEVNVDRDPAKSGLLPDAAEEAVREIAELPGLETRGLMTIGRLTGSAEASRGTFRALRGLSETLRARIPGLGSELSMGMTDDFEVAIDEGATVVRIGRAIFGERPHDHGAGPHVHAAGQHPNAPSSAGPEQ
jgi:pyridoxal phosphate enzyme (YggS family)